MIELREFYLASLESQIEALEIALAAYEQGDVSARDSIQRVAHQLKGSGASYGFDDVTERALDVLNASGGDVADSTRSLIDLLIELAAGQDDKTETVLVVEDDPVIQALLGRTLEAPRREIVFASTMVEGRDRLADGPNLLILDLFLPDADGRQLLVELRRDPATGTLPVIVLSGNDSDVARAECLALGADEYLQKPFDAAALLALVDSVLRAEAAAGLREAMPGIPAEPEPTESVGSRSILLAEDDDLVAALIVDRLTRDGFEMVRCSDGEAALAEARRNPPDVAILDVKMPKMDGFEVLSHLREIPELADTPVIVLTAMGSEHDVVRGFDLGADDYVLKPFSPTELAARVQRLVHQQ